ncbi:tryptophan 2,3-dioxygenase [Bradyrhizobium sediminis]|uniref:Tryptophan 2,3-dioxygenase n=1 Tax=Bradyrhizobium sediminis TaxID=2840469 RepID=A0A975RQV1_9BRAD|nr:tryptophan 2,3-dioxygenase [Bradyrhizobium sediminis]QWG17232.1 tryptophan 2,3-dioxygenase [Bradyrhizobium sediminis]
MPEKDIGPEDIVGSSNGADAMSQRREMSYSDYLQLDRILKAQQPLSAAHDEMLFIVQHQTSELWMKLAIHELNATCRLIAADDLQPAFKTLSRVSRIFEQLNSAWDVLRTMTPSEYTEFRGSLGQSSGFQSWQYRMIEFLVGNKNAAMIAVHQHDNAIVDRLEAVRRAPGIYDLTIQLLDRRGLGIDKAVLERDVSVSHVASDSVLSAWLTVYRDPARYWELYELAEKLVDFEDYFRRWRFNHVTTVERVIGFKRGTGGTSGVSYLRKMLDVVLFPELWQARTQL